MNTMKTIKVFDIETENARFELTISAKPDGMGYVGEYYGTAPKFAQVVRSGLPTLMMEEIGWGRLVNEDLEKLIVACRAEIEKLDGEIQRTIKRKI